MLAFDPRIRWTTKQPQKTVFIVIYELQTWWWCYPIPSEG